jgi:leucine dehydrogenase
MQIFDLIGEASHEQVVFCYEPDAGYRGIIAIHNSTLGPALGGTRLWNYQNDLEALIDVLRLSKGMTYKAAVSGLNLGGGKAVIIGDPKLPRREMLFRAHGRFVESLKGRYITAEDVGTSVEDMDFVHMETEHVTGIAGRSGDPSPVTAYGVYRGIKACVLERFAQDNLRSITVAVQGLGHVGLHLCRYLTGEGARLIVADIDEEKVRRAEDEFGAKAVRPDEIYGVEAEVFAPSARGAVGHDESHHQ